jgi:hypothetical protein
MYFHPAPVIRADSLSCGSSLVRGLPHFQFPRLSHNSKRERPVHYSRIPSCHGVTCRPWTTPELLDTTTITARQKEASLTNLQSLLEIRNYELTPCVDQATAPPHLDEGKVSASALRANTSHRSSYDGEHGYFTSFNHSSTLWSLANVPAVVASAVSSKSGAGTSHAVQTWI